LIVQHDTLFQVSGRTFLNSTKTSNDLSSSVLRKHRSAVENRLLCWSSQQICECM